MRRSRLKKVSNKRATLNASVKEWRENRVQAIGCCMICHHSPTSPWRAKPKELSQLCVHEIANGPHRAKALDKPYATLVLCWWCNGFEVTDKARWPVARQLALLKTVDPSNYDLEACNALIAPVRIDPEEVDRYYLF